MKTHEFAKHLELLAQFLRQLPDTEIDPKLAPDMQGMLPGFSPVGKGGARQSRPLPEGIAASLEDMSPAEVEAYLSSDDEVFTVANLSALAGRLGLTTSKRQSKSALVNMITRYFEAGKMHSIIRGTRTDDT